MFFDNSITINAETFNDVVIQTIQELFSENIKLYSSSGKFGVRGTMFKHCKIEDKCYFAFCLESSCDEGKYDINYVIEAVHDTGRKTITIKVADSEYGDKKCVKEKVLILSQDSCTLDRIGHIHIKQPFLIDKIVTLCIMLYVRLHAQPDNKSFYNISFSNILSNLLEDDVMKDYISNNSKHLDTIFQVVMHESTTYYTSFEPTPKALKDYRDNMNAICDIAQKVADKTGYTITTCKQKPSIKDVESVKHKKEATIDIRKQDMPKIKKIIYNAPAVIILWEDGTKTIAKCQKGHEDEYDPEIGLSVAVAKKYFGNRNKLKKQLPKE